MSRTFTLTVGVVGVTLVLVLVYAQVYRFDFVSFDDYFYLHDNDVVRNGLSWSGFEWAWSTIYYCWWHPLTWLSHMLDVELYGLHAGGHHVTSVAIHLINTLLVGLLAHQLRLSPAMAVWATALIMLHPTRAESVAWVSERKDVLCFMFGVLTTLSWVAFRRTGARVWYLAMIAAYLLCVASKSALVTLPVVLLIAEAWRAGRWTRVNWRRRLIEVLPLFGVALVAGIVTLIGQSRDGAMISLQHLPVGHRLGSVPVAYLLYLEKTVFPVELVALYPRELYSPSTYAAAAGGLLAIAAALIVFRRRAWHLAHGCLAFAVMLAPTIGVITVGASIIADRYLYYPHVPLFIGLVLTLRRLVRRLPVSGVLWSTAAVAVAAWFAVLSYFQVSTWRDPETLFSYALHLQPHNSVVQSGLGRYLAGQGRYEDALPHLREAAPADPEAQAQLANVLLRLGSREAALSNGRRALERLPTSPTIRVHVAKLLTQIGMADGRAGNFLSARTYLHEACALDRGNQRACRGLALVEAELAAPPRVLDAGPTGQETPRGKTLSGAEGSAPP